MHVHDNSRWCQSHFFLGADDLAGLDEDDEDPETGGDPEQVPGQDVLQTMQVETFKNSSNTEIFQGEESGGGMNYNKIWYFHLKTSTIFHKCTVNDISLLSIKIFAIHYRPDLSTNWQKHVIGDEMKSTFFGVNDQF